MSFQPLRGVICFKNIYLKVPRYFLIYDSKNILCAHDYHSVFNCFFSDLDPSTSKIHDKKSKSLKFHEKKILQIGRNMKKLTKREEMAKGFLKSGSLIMNLLKICTTHTYIQHHCIISKFKEINE